jgi:cytochrome c peroxidase
LRARVAGPERRQHQPAVPAADDPHARVLSPLASPRARLYVGGDVAQPAKGVVRMTLAMGERLPPATFLEKGSEGIAPVTSAELLDGRRVVLFALPGAFTGVCSTQHLPSFIRVIEALRGKGVEEVACVAVNDPHVMLAWGESSGATAAGIRMLADPAAEFARALDMTFDNPAGGLYSRSRRYALMAEDGVVRVLNLETSRTSCEISGGEAMLDAL